MAEQRESAHRTSLTAIARTVKEWGIPYSYLASRLGVSRQYVWQIMHGISPVTPIRVEAIALVVDEIIRDQDYVATLGDRLRVARKAAGLTLKQVAMIIGYSWVAVERWEKNRTVPGIPLLLKLCEIYRVRFEIDGGDARGVSNADHRQRWYDVPGRYSSRSLNLVTGGNRSHAGATIRISRSDFAFPEEK